MYMMVIKASLLLVAIITMLGAAQTQPISDLLIIFVAGGVVPGTNFVVPPQIILVTVAVALLMLAALIFRRYAEHKTTMRLLQPEYGQDKEDPAYTALVPGLAKAQQASRSLGAYLSQAAPRLYAWLKHVVRATRAQTPEVRANVRAVLAKVDGWTSVRVLYTSASLRKWSTKALSYVMRVTTF